MGTPATLAAVQHRLAVSRSQPRSTGISGTSIDDPSVHDAQDHAHLAWPCLIHQRLAVLRQLEEPNG